ncbi:MAG: UbiX family flavin prenyltransferase [Planctomycetes bacterium]|nr:UbiX family flavin prenyltransferase [Planctomycetota bacterium]
MGTSQPVQLPLLVGITGASGMPYAQRLLRYLSQRRIPTHLVVSPAATLVIAQELGLAISPEKPDVRALGADPEIVQAYHHQDFNAPMASGTFRTAGMAVIPCSTGTLGAVANGVADNLIRRAAEVVLKERRPLVLVLRETPLSLVHLENAARATRAGACVLPACPGFYHGVQTVDDLVNFVVTKTLDQFGLESDLILRWGTEKRRS